MLEKSVLEKEPTQTGELGEKVGEPVAGLPFFDIDEMIPFADEIVAAMDKDPDEVAINLIENASGDDSNSKALLNFLSKATYDQIYELITPYKDNPKLSSYVQKIIENRKWIEDVIEQLKTLGMQYQEA